MIYSKRDGGNGYVYKVGAIATSEMGKCITDGLAGKKNSKLCKIGRKAQLRVLSKHHINQITGEKGRDLWTPVTWKLKPQADRNISTLK